MIGNLIDAIKTRNAAKAVEWSKSIEWSTIEHFLVDGGLEKWDLRGRGDFLKFFLIEFLFGFKAQRMAMNGWECSACTFYNEPTYTECNMCATPRVQP